LTQVGLIVAEIGASPLGPPWLRYLILVHILGHACLRTLQFLRAPTLLHDYHTLENAIGGHLAPLPGHGGHAPASSLTTWLYRFALHRGYLDAFLGDYIARPVLGLLAACDRWERRWTDWLSGPSPANPGGSGSPAGSLEDLS
jgi:NAD(P)H-quinone oxidoreductase subunit 5